MVLVVGGLLTYSLSAIECKAPCNASWSLGSALHIALQVIQYPNCCKTSNDGQIGSDS